MRIFESKRFGVLSVAIVALAAASSAGAQRVDSTHGSKLTGVPRASVTPPPLTSTSLQNSSSQAVGAWSENMMNKPYASNWLFDYSVIKSDITAVDGKVVVSGSVSFSYTILENVATHVNLLRNGVLVQSWAVPGVASPIPQYAYSESNQAFYAYHYGGAIPISWVDMPGAGRHTYEVRITGGTRYFANWVFYFNGGSLAIWQ